MDVLPACIYVHCVLVFKSVYPWKMKPGFHRGQKRVSDPLEPE